LSVNPTGEFFITRDIKKINKKISNSYVLVGTFSTIDKQVIINARIMDNQTGRVVAAAKTYYETTDCYLLNNCPKPRMIRITGK
ncbi:MAG: FlgO family outer membrane protein, partial [Arcobacteraceae bacterium]